ncbi:putative ribonuclease H-like domain-containing protein, partial [Tanacetum coccineum]
IYGMIAGMESDPDSERKATSEYALMGFTTDKEVQTCSFECEYKYNELKKLYNEQREEISNSSVERCHQKNQLAYEEKIRILKFDLEDKSNLLAYHEKLVANAAQEKQALQAKLDNELANTANWIQSSKNLIKLIDSSISVKDKVGLGYGSYENELYIDNEPSIFDSRPEDWLGKPLYSWFTKEGDMHGVPPPMTGNYMPTPVHVEIDESQSNYPLTPYELLTGIVPTINYLKPFGCHVTILNTIDQLGKFDGKSDEGFLVGYSTQGKAYRVYNLASKRVEETMNVKFLENKPNVAQTGPAWYFDLDYLTDSMDYSRVRSTNPSAGPSNATTNNAGSQDTNDSDTDDDQDVIILPSYPSNATSSSSKMAPQDSSSVKSHSSPVSFAQAEEDLVFSAAKSFQTPSTNAVTPGSTPVTPGSTPVTPGTPLTLGTPVTPASAPFATSTSPNILSVGASSLRYPYPSIFANEFATGSPILKDIYDNPGSGMFTSSSYDDEEPRADLTNMSSTENVNPTFTKRVKSALPSSLIIRDIASSVQTRSRVNKSSNGKSALVCYIKNQRRNNHTDVHHCLFACFLSQTEPRSVTQALEDPSWVEAMQEEMQQF